MVQQTNVPSAEQLLRLAHGALRHEALFSPPVLAPWQELLAAVVRQLDEAIAPKARLTGLAAARATAGAADAEFDRAHRFLNSLLSAFTFSSVEAERAAATLCLASLYPDKLSVVNTSYADEVASGPTFAKRLSLPAVQSALATLAQAVPGLSTGGQAVVAAAAALGHALDGVDALLVDDAGQAASGLFEARVKAHQQFALFAQVVSNAAYPEDTPEHKAARTALIGPYLRYLASGASPRTAPPAFAEPAEAQA